MRNMLCRRPRARVPRGWAVFLVLLPLGCGGSDGTPPPTEADVLSDFVREMDDKRHSASGFAACFAKGAAPSEALRKQRYAKCSFIPASKPRMQGDTATIKVKIHDAATDKEIGQVEWTFVREGEKWKLKAAPLP